MNGFADSLRAELASCPDCRILKLLRQSWASGIRALIEAEARRRNLWG